jgi:hypothetical protein
MRRENIWGWIFNRFFMEMDLLIPKSIPCAPYFQSHLSYPARRPSVFMSPDNWAEFVCV